MKIIDESFFSPFFAARKDPLFYRKHYTIKHVKSQNDSGGIAVEKTGREGYSTGAEEHL
jgi:hypothetical protein